MNELALQKIFYELNFKNWKSITIALENEVNRVDLMSNPVSIKMDWVVIDTSSISYVKELDLQKDVSDTAMAWAQTLIWALRVVAVERVRSYESNPSNGKMSIKKLSDRMNSFQNNWKDWDKEWDPLRRYVELYRSNWWE